jgi:ubiquinone/menaquinone biosynthesis C-methylase UbiE
MENDTFYNFEQLLENEKGWLFYDAAFKAWKTIYRNLRGSKILDVGCGTGIMMALSKLFSPHLHIEGLEGSDESRSLWEKRGLRVQVGDIFKMPFEDNAFDTIYSSHVLEHLQDPTTALREMERVAAQRIITILPDGNVEDKNFGSPHLHVFNRVSIVELHSCLDMNLVEHHGIFDEHMNQLVVVYERI